MLGEHPLGFRQAPYGAAVLPVGLTGPAGEVREVLFVGLEHGLVLVGGGLLADGALYQVQQLVGW